MTTALVSLAMTGTATAATYTPSTFSDEDGAAADCPADGNAAGCSLREALKAANGNAADDTIALSAGRYEIDPTLAELEVADNGKLLIRGAGARSTAIDANGQSDNQRVLIFDAGSESDVQDVTLTGGRAGDSGGAAVVHDGQPGDAVVRFTRVAITGSEAAEGWGGAILNNGDVTLIESLVTSNEAAGHGGGIYNNDELTLVNSTISGNDAGFNGGGIHNSGFSAEDGEGGVVVENSTISANRAPNGNGGGIFTGPPEFEEECGFCEASARVVAFTVFASASFHNAVVSGNTASGEANCSGNQPKDSSSPSSKGYNIEDGETCEFKSTGDKDDDPRLADLADNGGPTDTHALKDGSPAIDAGDPDATRCEDIDQRGVTRFQRAGCDMGAYEAGEVPQPPNDIPTTQQTPRGEPEAAGDTCSDRLPPLTTLRASGLTVDSDSVTLVGRSRDRGDPCPSGVQRVEVSMAKVSGTDLNCRFVRSSDRFVITPFRNCRRPILFVARGTTSWRFVFRGVLPPGKYRAQARGYDIARNKETPKKRRNIIVFDVP